MIRIRSQRVISDFFCEKATFLAQKRFSAINKYCMGKNKYRDRALIRLAAIVVGCGVIWLWVGGVTIIHDQNNYPQVKDGDLIITCKLTGYHRNDLVLYKTADGTKLGRIVALEGDTVEIKEGYYLINEAIPYEEVFYPTYPSEGLSYPVKIKEGYCFILNDCRQQLADSREYGSIELNCLKGKVVYVFRYRNI